MSSLQQPTSTATGASSALDADSVLTLLQSLLPAAQAQQDPDSTSSSDTRTSEPTVFLSSPYEGLASLSHAIMTAVGFRLVGLGEDDSLENDRLAIDDLSRANVLPSRWNASSESYSFRYTHSQSSLTYLIKCMRIAGKFVIHGTAIETSQICSLELPIKDYTSPSYFPFTTATASTRDPLWNGFISRSRINDLISEYKIKIVQQLIPGLSKPGYQEERVPSSAGGSTTTGGSGSNTGRSGSTTGSGQGRGYYPDDSSRFPGVGGVPHPGRPFVPRPPIFGDPFSAEDPDFGGFGGGGGRNPFNIGGSDLDPFGGRLGGGIGGGGIGGFGGGIGGSTGGGMIVGPNHPMFRRPPPGGGGGGGIYGGPQPLPRGSVPPGARFDPIGPFGPGAGAGYRTGGNAPGAGTAHQDPLREPGRPGQGPVGPGAGAGTGSGTGSGAHPDRFSGEPDNDEPPPPGYMDMFM
ncbi:proteasome inhibitor subunit 1 (PI31) [Entomortierella parvispora]|uniref:Proteasome inhibitor subunit 1 (PI31) n=1 Tax=Entomortierella parvispora TaxID=205924 RepID=A0A9P3H330_9FUNG|nr:proteasome inhibitor subunit 1 (PI31) [Entomortierella parvispora]